MTAHQAGRLGMGVTAAYGTVLAFAMGHHELWRDEMQAWMLARDSTDPLDLLRNMEYEASGMLWHLLLMPITRMTDSPVGMQVLNWLIACTAVFVTVRHAPLKPLHRALLPFGYFPLIEYGMMARSYALGLLGIVVACALLKERHRHPIALGAALGLASHTSALACILAGGIVVAVAARELSGGERRTKEEGGSSRRLWVGVAVAIAGIALAVAQMAPPADVTKSNLEATWEHSLLTGWDRWKAEAVLRTVPGVVFLPLDLRMAPVVGWHQVHPQAVYGAWMTALLIGIALAYRRRDTAGMALLLGVGGALLVFFYAVHYGSMRHHGHLLVAVLVAAWAGSALRGKDPRRASGGIGGVLVMLLLAGQALGAARAMVVEVALPFSQAMSVAEYIQAAELGDMPMVGYPDWSASAVLGHMGRQKRMHYAQGDRDGTFVKYDGARKGGGEGGTTRTEEILRQVRELAEGGGGKALLIMGGKAAAVPETRRLRPVASFTGAIARDESFDLYLYEAE